MTVLVLQTCNVFTLTVDKRYHGALSRDNSCDNGILLLPLLTEELDEVCMVTRDIDYWHEIYQYKTKKTP